MTDRDIMKKALDALKQSSTNAPFDAHGVVYVEGVKIHKAAIAALNERLAQPEQEPVAVHQFRKPYTVDWYDPYKTRTPYTAPPQPEQEPIGYWPEERAGDWTSRDSVTAYRTPKAGWIPVYTTPPAAQPSTEESSAVQPEQEPVAWGVFDGPNLHDMFFTEQDAQDMARLKGDGSVVKPLCTTTPKRQWAGLTVEEMNEMTWGKTIYEILELAEAKLKEKNNGN